MCVSREVLLVKVAQFLIFRLDCPVKSHLLRVVDNDTGRELPRAVHVTKPQVYNPNQVSEQSWPLSLSPSLSF